MRFRLIRAPGITHELCSYPAVLSSSYLPLHAFRTSTSLSHRPSDQWVNTRAWPCTAYLRIRNLKKPMCHYLYVRYYCWWYGWRINKDYSILFYSNRSRGVSDSPTRRGGEFLEKYSDSDSPTHRAGELSTPRLAESENGWLPDSPNRFSFFDYEYLRELKPKSERLEMYCKGPMLNRFMQKPWKIGPIAMTL